MCWINLSVGKRLRKQAPIWPFQMGSSSLRKLWASSKPMTLAKLVKSWRSSLPFGQRSRAMSARPILVSILGWKVKVLSSWSRGTKVSIKSNWKLWLVIYLLLILPPPILRLTLCWSSYARESKRFWLSWLWWQFLSQQNYSKAWNGFMQGLF